MWRQRGGNTAVPQSCQCNVTGFEQKITHTDIFVPACALRSVQGRHDDVCARPHHWRRQDCPLASLFGQSSLSFSVRNPHHRRSFVPTDDGAGRCHAIAGVSPSSLCPSAGQYGAETNGGLCAEHQSPCPSFILLICFFSMPDNVRQHHSFYSVGNAQLPADNTHIIHINKQWDIIY